MSGTPHAGPAGGDGELVARLRAGDEQAFAQLVQAHSRSMLHVALMHVPSRAVAEEVVQEAWLGVLRGLDRFEERSSFKTWLFTILVNRAKTRGERERRTIPFASLAAQEIEAHEPAVDPARFAGASGQPGAWAAPPERWDEQPERALQSAETQRMVRAAIEELPPMQRLVITMRDLEGWESKEVCNALHLSETNQRVLLHRARSKVRAALEEWIAT